MKKQTKLGLVLAAAAVISVSVASLVSARGWVQNGADWFYVDNNNEYVTDTIQASGTAKFYLGENGAMQRDYFLESYGDAGNAYYFGSNGAMVTNTWVAIESSQVENQEDYIPDNYWYYFQASGKAMKGTSDRMKVTTIDGKKYGFNEYGQLCTGWITSAGKVVNPDDEPNPFAVEGVTYYAGGDNDGVLRAGWVTYYDGYDGEEGSMHLDKTNLYFYFNTSNNKMYKAQTKKVNGRTYAFDNEGVMMTGWDVFRDGQTGGEQQISGMENKVVYFSTDDDGHQVKKGWVYAVPANAIDSKAYRDDEEKYMYFNASGTAVLDTIKKINNKFYVFARNGIMKTGLVIWANAGFSYDGETYHYVDKLDLDWATGEELAKKGWLRVGGDDVNQYAIVNTKGEIINNSNEWTDSEGTTHHPLPVDAGDLPLSFKLHLFGDDGARKTGTNNVEFADDVFTFQSNNGGDRGSGSFSKKYYSVGILCKASPDLRYGMYNIASPTNTNANEDGMPLGKQEHNYYDNLDRGNYVVLTTSGSRQKGNKAAKKDADGNYWLIRDDGSSTLRGIWSKNVNSSKSISSGFKTAALKTPLNAFSNGTIYKTASISQAWEDGKFMYQGINTKLDRMTWTCHKTAGTVQDTVYFTSRSGYTGYAYNSDINDGTNKWIPFGVVDNANATVVEGAVEAQGNDAFKAYVVEPNSEYFLNCYWKANE